MKDRLLAMLALQDTMNQKVHPQWRTQGFNWTRAIMVEGVEALEHYGWKWWKKQDPDLVQFRIELVDIWHFIMSHMIEAKCVATPKQLEYLADHLELCFQNGAPRYLVESDPRKNLEILIARAATGEIHMMSFLALMEQVSLSFDGLYSSYVAKNVLNMFRQDNGYKAGTYIKMWQGREDNEVMSEYLKLHPDITPAELRKALEDTYVKVQDRAATA